MRYSNGFLLIILFVSLHLFSQIFFINLHPFLHIFYLYTSTTLELMCVSSSKTIRCLIYQINKNLKHQITSNIFYKIEGFRFQNFNIHMATIASTPTGTLVHSPIYTYTIGASRKLDENNFTTHSQYTLNSHTLEKHSPSRKYVEYHYISQKYLYYKSMYSIYCLCMYV